jgi:hypothetical protein
VESPSAEEAPQRPIAKYLILLWIRLTASLGSFCQNNCDLHEIFTGSTLFVDGQYITMLSLVGVLTIPLLIGFGLGYGAREMISRRRREAARLRHIND